MSSDLEENADHLDDPNANSSSAETHQSPEKKDNCLIEHAKPRRRRRGKKRKHKKESAATCEAENHKLCGSELHVEHDRVAECGDSQSWDSDENLSCDVDTFSDVIIRPLNVPKAPENSTQFIMDDHNDCHFYMSFETPNPYLADPPHPEGEGDIVEPLEEDAAYRDIDYQYESPQDFDNSAYYDREFELSYKNNRFDELMRSSRTELISALQGLEIRLQELTSTMLKENPSPILEQLQAELLELQEKNGYLKESNTKLASLLSNSELSVTESSENVIRDTAPEPLTSVRDRELLDSGEVYHECKEAVEEVVMADLSMPNCDRNCIKSESNSGHYVNEQTKHENISNRKNSSEVDTSGDEQTKLNLSSHIIQHCQSANIITKDDIRTLSISSSSDIFHAKCSSSVPIEGGMSPSETSVN